GSGGYRPTYIIPGLWLLEQILPHFDTRPKSDADWAALIDAAEDIPAPDVLIDIADSRLFHPECMKKVIDDQLHQQGVTPPESLPGYMRLICESLGQAIGNSATQFGRLTAKN